MPMAAAATVTLNMVRILKTPLSGNNAAHDKPRVSSRVISELLRVLEKEPESSAKIKAPWPLGAFIEFVSAWATTPLCVTRY